MTTSYTVTDSNGTSDEVKVTKTHAPVDAGSDVTLNCTNPNPTLTAICGNGGYIWSTGATTASINPKPTTTTIYSVTASDGSSDQVTII
jgi:hypothetical protein